MSLRRAILVLVLALPASLVGCAPAASTAAHHDWLGNGVISVKRGKIGGLPALGASEEAVRRASPSNVIPAGVAASLPYTVKLYAFDRIGGTRPAFSIAVCAPRSSKLAADAHAYSITVKNGPEAAKLTTPEGLSLHSTYGRVVSTLGPPDQTRDQSATNSIALIYRLDGRTLTFAFNQAKSSMLYLAIEEPPAKLCG